MDDRAEIYVRPEEDIHSIIDSIEAASADELDIVVPSGSGILQNIVDAYLLKDAVEKSEASVRIVTNDAMGKTFAERAGIPFSQPEGEMYEEEVKEKRSAQTPALHARIATTRSMADIRPKTTMAKKKANKKKSGSSKAKSTNKKKAAAKAGGIGGVGKKRIKESQFLKNYKADKEKGDMPANFGVGSGKKRGRFNRLSPSKVVAGIFVLTLLIAGTVFAQVLPKAEVTLFPQRDNRDFTINVRVDQNTGGVSIEENVIPGELLVEEKTLSGEFEATGSADGDNRVRGTITIFNESGEAHTFVPSRFESENGLIFRTQETISIPAGTVENPGTVDVLVVADGPGAQYAIGSSRFILPALTGSELGEQVYARSDAAFTAPNGEGAGIVTDDDVERARDSLRADLEPQLRELRTTLPSGIVVWEEAYNEELAEISTNRQPGEQAETFTVGIRMVARAIAFQEEDLNALADSIIINQIAEDKTILPKSRQITFAEPPVVDYEAGTVEGTLQINIDVIEKIDAESFRGAIVNKDREQIENILNSYEGVESAQVNLWPFWVSSVPGNKDRVTVRINGT